jgi:hypothetical protein
MNSWGCLFLFQVDSDAVCLYYLLSQWANFYDIPVKSWWKRHSALCTVILILVWLTVKLLFCQMKIPAGVTVNVIVKELFQITVKWLFHITVTSYFIMKSYYFFIMESCEISENKKHFKLKKKLYYKLSPTPKLHLWLWPRNKIFLKRSSLIW